MPTWHRVLSAYPGTVPSSLRAPILSTFLGEARAPSPGQGAESNNMVLEVSSLGRDTSDTAQGNEHTKKSVGGFL